MDSFWYVLVFVIALLVTVILIRPVIKLAKRFNIIDYPDGRRIHDKPVPRSGGIALFAGIAVSLTALALFIYISNSVGGNSTTKVDLGLFDNINYFGVAASALMMFVLGLIDDIKDIRVHFKLLGQIAAAAVACLSGVLLSHFTNPFDGSIVELGFFAYPLTIFYLVAFANIINLIDGLDGLAAGITAISAATIFIISVGKGGIDAAVVTIAVAGACIAFLRYNSYPAKVFMGDSGALLLGFLLGLVSLFGVIRTPAIITLLVPVVIAGIPVIDTLSAIVRRLRAGKSVAAADTAHIHHRIIAIGYDQKTTVYMLYVLCGFLAICAYLLTKYNGWAQVVIAVVLIALVAVLIIRVGLMDPVLKHYYNKRTVEHHKDSLNVEDVRCAEKDHAEEYSGDDSVPREEEPAGETSATAVEASVAVETNTAAKLPASESPSEPPSESAPKPSESPAETDKG